MSKDKQKSDLDVRNIEIDKIHLLENSRVHYDEKDLSELMSSIRQHGLMQPVGVRSHPKKEGHFELLYGNRRFLALKKLGRDEIPAVVTESTGKDDFLVKNLVENLQRTNLTPFEEGRYFSLLKDSGLTINEIAVRVNVSPKKVASSITVFHHLPEEHRGHVTNQKFASGMPRLGKISANSAANVVQAVMNAGRPKKEVSEILTAVRKNNLNAKHLNVVSNLMRRGLTTKEAIKSAVSLVPVSLYLMVSEVNKANLEKKYKKGFSKILTEFLEAHDEFCLVNRDQFKKTFSRAQQKQMDLGE